jgi:hypothetical protein
MKAKPSPDQAAVASGVQGWWTRWPRSAATDDARERHDELLSQAMLMDFRAELAQKNAIDTLYRAGELEDSAAKMAAEAQELDNTGFKVVADYEQQRVQASELWYRACALEKQTEVTRQQIASRREKLAALPAGPQRKDLEAEIAGSTGSCAASSASRPSWRRRTSAAGGEEPAVGRGDGSGCARWSCRSDGERRAQGKKVRAEAERLFKQAEERKQRAHSCAARPSGGPRARGRRDRLPRP